MGTYYEKWLNQEREWIKAVEDGRKKQSYIYSVIAIVCCVVVLSGIGFMAGGVPTAVSNIKYGLILGVVSTAVYILIVLASGTTDKYMKRLQKEIAGEIQSASEREEFAREMLEGKDGEKPAACIEFVKQKGAIPERFCVTSDFALFRGMIPSIVRLDKTERIETDVAQTVSTINTGDYKIRMNYSTYAVYFYYNKPQLETGGKNKKKIDKIMLFPSREIRDKAAKMISRPQQ